MNLENSDVISLDRTEPVTAQTRTGAGFAVPDPAPTKEVPEASTWVLLLAAAAVWLLRLRRRQSRHSRGI
jgi:hypothetical protein